MSIVNCPHCRQGVANDPQLAGKPVACPHCRGQFRMPGTLATVPAAPLPAVPQSTELQAIHIEDQRRPVNILVNAGGHRERLKPGGWFTRSFSSAAGALIATVLILGAVCGGGVFWVRYKIDEVKTASRKRLDQAKKMALRELPHHGVQQLAEDCVFAEWGDHWFLSGKGRDRDGKLREVVVKWKIGKFGNTEQWEMQAISIDGDIAWSVDGNTRSTLNELNRSLQQANEEILREIERAKAGN